MSTEDQNRSKSSSSRVINSLLGGERDKGSKASLTKKKTSETRITSADANKTAIAGARPDAPSKGASQLTQLKNLLVGVKGKMQDKKKPTASPVPNNLGSNQSLSRPRTSQLQSSSSMTKMNGNGENSRISQKSMDRRLVKPSRTDKSKSITVKRDDLNTSQNGNSTNSKRSSKPSLLSSVFKKNTPAPGSQGLKLMSSKSSARVTQSSARSQSRGTSNLSAIKHLGLGKDSRSYLNGGEQSEQKEHSITPKNQAPAYHEPGKRRIGEISKTRTDEADTETSSQAPHLDQGHNLHKAQRQYHEAAQETYDQQSSQNAGVPVTQQTKKPAEVQSSKLNSFVTQVRPGQMFSDMSSKQVDLDKEIERALTPRISDRHMHEPSAIAMNGHILMPSTHPAMHLSNGHLNDDQWKQYYRKELIESLKSSDDQNPRVKAFREHLFQSAQSVLFLQNVERIDDNLLIEKKIYMPPNLQKKKTLILDLDETLIHCNDSAETPSDHKIKIKFANGDEVETGINVRPYALEFLKQMSQMFEVMIFTASHSCYANVVLNILDPNNEYITYRLFRDSNHRMNRSIMEMWLRGIYRMYCRLGPFDRDQCLQTNEGIFIKDLRIVANRSLDNVLIVDNATYSFGFQLENGIPILPYYEGQTDKELLYLMEYLKRIAHEPDVRPFNKTFFMYDVIATYCNEFEKLIDVMLTSRVPDSKLTHAKVRTEICGVQMHKQPTIGGIG